MAVCAIANEQILLPVATSQELSSLSSRPHQRAAPSLARNAVLRTPREVPSGQKRAGAPLSQWKAGRDPLKARGVSGGPAETSSPFELVVGWRSEEAGWENKGTGDPPDGDREALDSAEVLAMASSSRWRRGQRRRRRSRGEKGGRKRESWRRLGSGSLRPTRTSWTQHQLGPSTRPRP